MATLDGVFTALCKIVRANYDYNESESTAVEREIAQKVFGVIKSELQAQNDLPIRGTERSRAHHSPLDEHHRSSGGGNTSTSFLFSTSSSNLRRNVESVLDTSRRAGLLQTRANMSSSTLSRRLAQSSTLTSASPFYQGKTAYGGAAGRRSNRLASSAPYAVSLRPQVAQRVQVNPSQQPEGGLKQNMSVAARTIFESVEKNAQQEDARRNPIGESSTRRGLGESSFTASLAAERGRISVPTPALRPRVPPAPSLASTSTADKNRNLQWNLLQDDLRGRESDAMHGRHQRHAQSASTTAGEAKGGSQQEKSVASILERVIGEQPYNHSDLTCKMSRGVKSSGRVSLARDECDTLPTPVELPNAKLVIASDKMPSFNFATNVAPYATASAAATTRTTVATSASTDTKCNSSSASPSNASFKFAEPIVLGVNASTPNTTTTSNANKRDSSNQYSFSIPLAAKTSPMKASSPKTADTATNVAAFAPTTATTTKRSADKLSAEPSVPLSVMFAPKAGQWECDSCCVRNDQDKTSCVSCEASRAKVNKPTTVSKPSFSSGLTPGKSKRECYCWCFNELVIHNFLTRGFPFQQ